MVVLAAVWFGGHGFGCLVRLRSSCVVLVASGGWFWWSVLLDPELPSHVVFESVGQTLVELLADCRGDEVAGDHLRHT